MLALARGASATGSRTIAGRNGPDLGDFFGYFDDDDEDEEEEEEMLGRGAAR